MHDVASQGCVLSGPLGDVPSLGCLAQIVPNIITLAFVFLGAVTVLFIIWGAIKFALSRGDQKALQSARNTITYAILAAVLMVLAYFVIQVVLSLFGLPPILSNFTLFQN